MPANHADAIGYLLDLAAQVGKPWFTAICNLAIEGRVSPLTKQEIDYLLPVFISIASPCGSSPSSTTYSPSAIPSTDFLEQLSSFSNFKRLGCSLNCTFAKRISIVFGNNGSGKSSLCEALKLLAHAEPPFRPLKNLLATDSTAPQFTYKFKSDSSPQCWADSSGYGLKDSSIKFFDTVIAVKYIKNAIDPGRVIILTPFKLTVFENTISLTSNFREILQHKKQEAATNLSLSLENIRKAFVSFPSYPLSSISENTLPDIPAAIELGKSFNQLDLLVEKQSAAKTLEKALSDEGLKLLKAEHNELDLLLTSLNALLVSSEKLWDIHSSVKSNTLAAKQAALESLAKNLIPPGGTIVQLRSLLNAASSLCSLDSATHQNCPLCKQQLGTDEVDLFRKYHALITGDLEKEIVALQAELNEAATLLASIRAINPMDWDRFSTLPEDFKTAIKAGAGVIISNCSQTQEPSQESRTALTTLKGLHKIGLVVLQQKATAINAAESGKEEIEKRLKSLRNDIIPMEYAKIISESLPMLTEAQSLGTAVAFWNLELPYFTALLRNITNAAKSAHDELIVSDFETRLNEEYKALAEKPMSAYGVTLAKIGADASVTVRPKIGNNDIEGVLSEGEQRLHALALFFAELETCSHPVIVFDDPVSSFDYNYIANYCLRLRDFAKKYPDRQIIVLTHNWEFFVQLQTTLNKGALNGQLTIQVIENCATVAEYSEKVDELKARIESVLAQPRELSREEKEEIAGNMRRLIEAIVNTHVFNKQRHQYKQKSQPVSEFQLFTKLVPLLPAEATRLQDLYEKLSITEHDDPRNAYVSTDKASFQTRYTDISTIETDILRRKAPTP